MLLRDKVIFLTGGSAGIGLECAKAYAAAGAKVAVMSWNREDLNSALEQLGALETGLSGEANKNRHYGIEGDVSKDFAVKSAIDQILGKYGRIDAIHNNAGIASPSLPIHQTSDDEWDLLMNVNLRGILYTTRYGFEALKASKGCILNTSSLVGEIGQAQHAAYAATKGAVNALTKSMALDYAPYGIRVNSLMPAAVWTPMLRDWNQEQEHPEVMADYLDRIHPLGYCPDGDVIADVATFLLSSKARFITGCNLPVSGGAELGYRAVLK